MMSEKKWNSKVNKIPRWFIGFVTGILCLVVGFFGDQFVDIFQKAVMICLECIGIG